jgi:radical SAM protein with 4Fe4S-binding SPASM domain
MATAAPELKVLGTYTGYRPTIYWYLSFRCNLQCKHCSVQSSPFVDSSGDLSTEDALMVVRKMTAIRPSGVILTGGEPLLRTDFLTIYEALTDAHIEVAIETNGLLVTDHIIDALLMSKKRGISTTICISLDGGTREAHDWMRGQGTFDRTVETLRKLWSAGLKFRVQCVLHDGNYCTINDLFELTSDFPPLLDYLIFAFLHPVGRGLQMWNDKCISPANLEASYGLISRGIDHYPGQVSVKLPPAMISPKYLDKLFGKTNKCTCNTSCNFPTLGILPAGDVTVCALTRNDPSVMHGNIKIDLLSDICHHARLDALREEYLAAKLTGACADCIFAPTCKGSCRAYAYEEFSDFSAPHPLCDSLYKRGLFPSVYRTSFFKPKTAAKEAMATDGVQSRPPVTV